MARSKNLSVHPQCGGGDGDDADVDDDDDDDGGGGGGDRGSHRSSDWSGPGTCQCINSVVVMMMTMMMVVVVVIVVGIGHQTGQVQVLVYIQCGGDDDGAEDER